MRDIWKISRSRAHRQRRLALAAYGVTAAAVLATLVIAIRMSQAEAGRPADDSLASVLAVLPFDPVVPDPKTDYFGIGLADSIVNHLAGVPGLTVRPMSAALSVASEQTDPIQTGRKLQAAAVLVGKYRQAKDRLVVTVRLLDIDNGATLWEHRLESRILDLTQVELKIVGETLATLMPRLKREEKAGRQATAEPDPSAHYLYLLARGKLATWQSEPIPEAVELLEQAIKADPGFAPAHASLAEASANMFLGGHSADTIWIDRAVAAGRRAVSLDGRDPSAHYALGHALVVSGDPVEATRETLLALQLDPHHAYAQRLLGSLLAGAGLSGPVHRLRDQALKEDPSIEVGWLQVWPAVLEGRIDETIAALRQEVERRRESGLSPELPIMCLGYLALEAGDAASGLHWAAMLEDVSANLVYADMIRLLSLARTGDADAVARILQKNHDAYARDAEYSQLVGRALALLGERESALSWLERAARLGSHDAISLERSDAMDSLRADPRFQEVLSILRGRARRIIQLAQFAGYR